MSSDVTYFCISYQGKITKMKNFIFVLVLDLTENDLLVGGFKQMHS